MKVEIRFRGLESSETLREHAVRRVHAHMSRFGREVQTVLVRISDVNGPKGGVDKRCQVVMRGRSVGVWCVDEQASDAYASVDLAVDRASRALGRLLERARSRYMVT